MQVPVSQWRFCTRFFRYVRSCYSSHWKSSSIEFLCTDRVGSTLDRFRKWSRSITGLESSRHVMPVLTVRPSRTAFVRRHELFRAFLRLMHPPWWAFPAAAEARLFVARLEPHSSCEPSFRRWNGFMGTVNPPNIFLANT